MVVHIYMAVDWLILTCEAVFTQSQQTLVAYIECRQYPTRLYWLCPAVVTATGYSIGCTVSFTWPT